MSKEYVYTLKTHDKIETNSTVAKIVLSAYRNRGDLREQSLRQFAEFLSNQEQNKENFLNFHESSFFDLLFERRRNLIERWWIKRGLSRKTREIIDRKKYLLLEKSTYSPKRVNITTTIDNIRQSDVDIKYLTRNPNKRDKTFKIEDIIFRNQTLNLIRPYEKEEFEMYFYPSIEIISNEGIQMFLELQNSGKGMNENQARLSLLFEAYERHFSLPDEKIFETYDANQYGLNVLNEENSHINRFQYLEKFAKYPIGCLNAEDGKLVPAENVFWMYLSNQPMLYFTSGISYVGTSSTGLASGKSKSEAKYHSLMEVIEHASLIQPKTERSFYLNPKSIEDARIRSLIEKYNPVITLHDCGLGIPVFSATYGNLTRGMGAHLNGSIALTRAILEMNVGSPGYKGKLADQNLKTENIEDVAVNYSTGNDRRDLLIAEQLLNANNIKPIYVNLSQQNSRVSLYKTIVPELFIDKKRIR